MLKLSIFEDFPRNEVKFDKMFATEEACKEYFFKMKWSEGFVCSRCGNQSYWKNNRDHFVCRTCGHQHSLTSETMLSGTKKPLKLWFKAIWLFTTKKTGESASSIQGLLGVSYQTAWSWLQKLRLCTVRENREKLSGRLEVDEFYLGGKEIGKQGRGAEKKVKVVAAVEKRGIKTGRIRLQAIEDVSSKSLMSFIESNIEDKSKLKTDGWSGYLPLNGKNFDHLREIISKSDEDASTLLPGVHLVASLFKRMILGIYQGRFDKKHVQKYLDEFTFRYNRRTSSAVGKKFFRMLEQVICITPKPYWQIIGRKAPDVPLWEIST